jgi:hypothetical protein
MEGPIIPQTPKTHAKEERDDGGDRGRTVQRQRVEVRGRIKEGGWFKKMGLGVQAMSNN